MMTPLRSRLWVRLAGLFVLASVVPILGAGVLTVQLLEDAVRDDAARRHRALADLGGALVRDLINRANEKLTTVGRLLAKETAERKDDREVVLDRLNNLVEPPDIFLELEYYARGQTPQFVGRAQQREYQSAQTMVPQYEVEQEKQVARNSQGPLVQAPLGSNELFVSPQTESNLGFPVLPISVPVGSGKTAMGALVAYIDFRRVDALLGTVASGGYHARLVDGEGKVLASAGAETADMIGDWRPARQSDWKVEVREPAARVYAALVPVRNQALLWIGLALVLAVGLGVGIAAYITKPVSVLTRTAQAMEAGDLTARANIARDDEIGRLAAAFDKMAAALHRLDEAKSEFVANVSHELRTPLTSIRLSIANLLDGVVGPLDDRQRATLTRLRADVERMIRLVNDLLEVARLEAGAVEPRRERFDLAVLAHECAAAIEPLAREKGISVDVSGEGSVEADRAMVHRVLTNLLDNAVKFTNGRVAVTVAGREFKVGDTGPGVDVEGLFGKFVQGRQEGVKIKGFGLGLAIVKKLVDLHGGTIEVANRGGAVFTVRL